MQKLYNPVPTFLDADGALLDGGRIYVGEAGEDPETSPIPCYWDKELTIPAAQPLRTVGGMIVNDYTPAAAFIAEDDYSMRLADSNNVQIFYSPSVYTDTNTFQPRNADLDTISGQPNTAYGLGLLTLADQAALKTATGIPAPLPATGGTVSGGITRQASGVYVFWADAALTGGRIFLTDAGAGDPTSQPGDIWLEKAP